MQRVVDRSVDEGEIRGVTVQRMTVEDFASRVNGKWIQTNDGDGGECTAVPHQWEKYNNWPQVYGNAIDMFGNAPSSVYDRIENGPTNYPPPGATVVWHRCPAPGINTGVYGHVAVVLSADENRFTSVDQNWPPGSSAHEQRHDYRGVTGWFTAGTEGTSSDTTSSGPAESGPGTCTVTVADGLNIRTQPNTRSTVVAAYSRGTVLDVDHVVQGENVAGNPNWAHSPQGHYYWVGGTSLADGV